MTSEQAIDRANQILTLSNRIETIKVIKTRTQLTIPEELDKDHSVQQALVKALNQAFDFEIDTIQKEIVGLMAPDPEEDND